MHLYKHFQQTTKSPQQIQHQMFHHWKISLLHNIENYSAVMRYAEVMCTGCMGQTKVRHAPRTRRIVCYTEFPILHGCQRNPCL